MDFASLFGWIAAALVLSSACFRTMLPLRLVAIGSNLFFIAYAQLTGATPILVLHCLLLPLNTWRLNETLKLRRSMRDMSQARIDPKPLLPMMQRAKAEQGNFLFTHGEPADSVYLVLKGEVQLQRAEERVFNGQLVGLTSIFSNEQVRVDTAICLTDVEYGVIPAKSFWEFLQRNEAVSNHVIRCMASRQLLRTSRL